MLLSQAWDLYKTDKGLEGYSHHTLKAYNLQHNLLIRHFGNINISDISYDKLKEYLSKDVGRLKPASIGHRVRFLKSTFRWAIDEGIVDKNPASKLKEPKQGVRIPKFLSEEDTEMLREGCKTSLEHALIEFIYTTGCRVGEVYGLNKSDIDRENRSAIVRGKGDKEREVYFNIKCDIWLKKYLKERKDVDLALFVTERNPHRMSISQIRYIVKRITKRTEVETSVYPHRLRHSYATHLLNNGAPLEVIQSLLGHKKLETTKLYTNLSGSHRKEIYRRYF